MQALRAADGLVKVGMGMSTGVAGTALKGIASIVAPTPVPPPAAALISPTLTLAALAIGGLSGVAVRRRSAWRLCRGRDTALWPAYREAAHKLLRLQLVRLNRAGVEVHRRLVLEDRAVLAVVVAPEARECDDLSDK